MRTFVCVCTYGEQTILPKDYGGLSLSSLDMTGGWRVTGFKSIVCREGFALGRGGGAAVIIFSRRFPTCDLTALVASVVIVVTRCGYSLGGGGGVEGKGAKTFVFHQP